MTAHSHWTEIEGIPRRKWLDQCFTVREHRAGYGLTLVRPPVCQGGYCRRHGASQPVQFSTDTGLQLCSECATIWAVRRHFKLKHGIDDL